MDAKAFRRYLRKEQTQAEATFWHLVRAKRFNEFKFRRQHAIGAYTVDFYCPKLKLIVEIDGTAHDNLGQALYDDERDTILTNLGYKMIRFDNDSVLKNPEVVIAYLEDFIVSFSFEKD